MEAIAEVDTQLPVEEAEAALEEISKRLESTRNALRIAENGFGRTVVEAVSGVREAQERRFDEQIHISALKQDVAALELAKAEVEQQLTQAKLQAHGATREEHKRRALELAKERGKLGDELQTLLHRAGELYQKIGTLGPQIRAEWKKSGRQVQHGDLGERRLLELGTQELRTAGVPMQGEVPCRGVAMGPPPSLSDALKDDHSRFFAEKQHQE